jgi:hypothetical protein
MFQPNSAETPEEYIAQLEEPRRGEIRTLHELIQKLVPDLEPHMMSGMIAYGTYHYRYASGREGDWSVIALASRKQYISVYVCAADERGYLAERRKAEIPKADIGKSCIRFKKTSDIDLEVLMSVLLEGVEMMNQGSFAV